jgi:N-carbamoyl-L-amino-acid hydrolase
VDGRRLSERLAALARAGARPGGGVCRLALTDADREGRDRVVAWMRELDLRMTVDGIGNVVAVLPGREDLPPVMTGSHLDTVADGGRYDGSLGVLAGLEVVETLVRAGVRPLRPIAVASFTNEEGVRFTPDMLGSLVFCGGMDLEQALEQRDAAGTTVGDELERIGYRGSAPIPSVRPCAFVELHVEQGPVLEQRGATIGAVTGVAGISWTEIELVGQANHAGTTPMCGRRDPACGAAGIVTFVRRLALEIGGSHLGTVGRLVLRPNLVNVVPGSAELTVDLRNGDEAALGEAERRLEAHVEELARTDGLRCDMRRVVRLQPVAFDEEMVDLVEQSAESLAHSAARLTSGAGHDAQMMARVCPTTMIFVPSRGGVSHSPEEHTAPEHLQAGANVLLRTILALAERRHR